jgi:S1-C subfamily serine protease
VEVLGVQQDSAAAHSGVRPGDLIVAMNDRVVASVDDLHRLLSRWPIGTPLELSVVRGQRKLTLAIV